MIRDCDWSFGHAYARRVRAMGIRYHLTAPRSPWQNANVERLIGFDSSRMPRPRDRVRRGAIAPDPQDLRLVLQRSSDPPLIGGGRAELPACASGSATLQRCRSWAGCTINMCGFEFFASYQAPENVALPGFGTRPQLISPLAREAVPSAGLTTNRKRQRQASEVPAG